MTLRPEQATRVVQFCLAGDGWGEAVYEDEVSVVRIAMARGGAAAYRFAGSSFEDALQEAVSNGILKASSVEKQIAFVTGRAKEDTTERWDGFSIDPKIFSSVTAGISALVHETQRERGISSLYAASGGRIFGAELTGQWHRTDRQWAELRVLRRKQGELLPLSVRQQLDAAERLLASVVSSRERVRIGQVLPPELVAAYSQLNAEILRSIDELSTKVADPLQRPAALAWLALLYAKEKTGIERAQLATAFARDRFFEGQHRALSALIAGRECYLHLFAAAAPSAVAKQMRHELGAAPADTVREMEEVALSRQDGGFGVDAKTWFSTMTKVVDTLGRVEAALRVTFTSS